MGQSNGSAPAAQKSTVTIKVSKPVRDFLAESTDLNEPIDRTIRRLLGLKIVPGQFPPKGKLRKNHYNVRKSSVMTTVKVSQYLRDYLASKAKWNDSIDETLRRLLKVDGVKVEEKAS